MCLNFFEFELCHCCVWGNVKKRINEREGGEGV